MDHFSKAAVCLKVIKWFLFKCRNFPISPNQSHSLRNGITTSNPSHHQLQQYIHFNNDEQPQNQPMEQLIKKSHLQQPQIVHGLQQEDLQTAKIQEIRGSSSIDFLNKQHSATTSTTAFHTAQCVMVC